jgi:hypothetical protein
MTLMATHQWLLTGIKAIGLPKAGYPKSARKFYVKLIVDGEVKKTKIAPRGSAPIWEDTFEL